MTDPHAFDFEQRRLEASFLDDSEAAFAGEGSIPASKWKDEFGDTGAMMDRLFIHPGSLVEIGYYPTCTLP